MKKREDEREKMIFFWKNVSGPSNTPDESAQKVSKKNPSRTNYSFIFSSKVQNLTVISIIYMIRIRFFGSGELIQNGFSAALCGKKPGDKEYHTANQLKKTYKKKYVQGIHDRSIRDPEFRNRMIENNRDEELCRKWDALSDEDHTHHLTAQEYSLYKSNWWLHSNKQGSNTVRTTHRSDFKKGIANLAAIETKRRRSFTNAPGISQKSTMGTKFFFMVELARFMVDSLFL